MKDEAARIAAILGVLKANRIFIPLARSSPKNGCPRSSKTPEPRRSSSIVLPARLRSVPPPSSVTVVTDIEQLAGSLAAVRDRWYRLADDTAYIVYTSGSTGHQKAWRPIIAV